MTKSRTSVEDLLRAEKWREALAAIGDVPMGAKGSRPHIQRLRAFIGLAEVGKAKDELRRLLTFTVGDVPTLDLPEVTAVLSNANLYARANQNGILVTLADEMLAFLDAHPELRIGKSPKEVWGAIPSERWPLGELLDQLARCEGGELRMLLGVARARGPGDPRVAAAASKLARDEERALREEEARWDADEEAELWTLVGVLEKRVRIALPKHLRTLWGRHETAEGSARAKIDFLVLGARGTPLRELVAIATRIRDRHFSDSPPPSDTGPLFPFVPIAKDGDAWIGLYTEALPTAHDYAVLRVDDAEVTVVARSTEEWLAQLEA